MNRRMRDTIDSVGLPEFTKGEKLTKALSQWLAQGFTNIHGAIVFTAARSIGESIDLKNFPDLTGFECFVNHVHVEDHLGRSGWDPQSLVRQGVAFARETESRLRSEFPGQPFKVIVASTAQNCGVRFHLDRPGEQWLANDLDGYAKEALLVLEI